MLNIFSGCSGLLYISVTPDNTIYDSRDNCNAVVETSTNKLIVGCHNTLIPLSVTSIGKYAFEDCSTLTTINIPNNVTTIGEAAFKGCNNLTSVIIGKSLTSIGDGAFAGCSNLTSITIPYSVMNIGDYAFNSCSSLASVTVKNPSPVNIEQFTFSNRANATLYVPTGAKAAYQAADYWKEFKEIIEVEQSQSTISGDVDGDGTVSVTDVAWIVNHILGVNDNNFIAANADINGDGEIDINDVMATVSIILKGEVVNICPDDNHPHMIDLGLPSGTKWACCNVGADKPETYGGYYFWGEMETKTNYTWKTYIHCDGNGDTCYDLGSDIAGTQYDVAHVKWGGNWRMPTQEQYKELLDNCLSEWDTLDGINGRMFTSKENGNSIFLPSTGYRLQGKLMYDGQEGNYRTSNLSTFRNYGASSLYFSSNEIEQYDSYRYYGMTIRPVTSIPMSTIKGDVNGDGDVSKFK